MDTSGEWALADYVKKGIEVLDNDTGFFMMCEGGKIDWACHANDAGATVNDTLALADAVQVAIDFAKEHADKTLILVTGDQRCRVRILGGQFAGTETDAVNRLSGSLAQDKLFSVGHGSVGRYLLGGL